MRGAHDLARVLAHALDLGVNARDSRNGVVARRLGLRTRGAQDLLGLGLRRADAVLGRAVALGDALASTRLRLLAQAGRGVLGGGDDRCDARGDEIGLLALHGPMLDLDLGAREWQKAWDICPCGQALEQS